MKTAAPATRPPDSLSTRPIPPPELLDFQTRFAPSSELLTWVQDNILDPRGPIHNPDHLHLTEASIGFLWTNAENTKHQRRIVGQSEVPMYMGNKWQKARQELQVTQWFGSLPDFIITLDAYWAEQAEDAQFCAVVEHELYHCAQAVDEYGAPKFDRLTGKPKYAIKGHDVEEFVGVVRRYGVTDPEGPLADMLIAVAKGPEIAKVNVARACGTCMLRAA